MEVETTLITVQRKFGIESNSFEVNWKFQSEFLNAYDNTLVAVMSFADGKMETISLSSF
jgi:hypothetical protein